jgi:hypothetical protein
LNDRISDLASQISELANHTLTWPTTLLT